MPACAQGFGRQAFGSRFNGTGFVGAGFTPALGRVQDPPLQKKHIHIEQRAQTIAFSAHPASGGENLIFGKSDEHKRIF